MTVETMASLILEYVQARDFVTFVELERLIGPEAEGNMRAGFEPNLVIWDGASDEFLDAIDLLRDRGEIRLVTDDPTAEFTYFMDGEKLTLPLARRVPKGGYRRPHWCPVILRPTRPMGPGEDGPERCGRPG